MTVTSPAATRDRRCTRRFQALDYGFQVRADDPDLVRWMEEIFADLVAPDAPASIYDVLVGERGVTVRTERREICSTPDPAHAIAMMLWHINHEAVATSHGLLLHAGGVAGGGEAVILAGPSGVGKSTLTAALVRDGLEYLTDEVVSLDPLTLHLRPYRRPLVLKPGAQQVLANLAPAVRPEVAEWLPVDWHVPPAALRGGAAERGATAPSAQPRYLVFPRYERGAITELRTMARSDAMIAAAGSTFAFGANAARNVDLLGRLVLACDCYTLVVGDLERACRLVHGLFRSGGTGA